MNFDQKPEIASSQPPEHLDELVRFTLSEGAANARAISSAIIPVEDRLAEFCTTCPSYGFSMSCSPHFYL